MVANRIGRAAIALALLAGAAGLTLPAPSAAQQMGTGGPCGGYGTGWMMQPGGMMPQMGQGMGQGWGMGPGQGQGMMGQGMMGSGMGPGQGQQMMGGGPRGTMPAMIDADQDGRITEAEAAAHLEMMFGRLDADGDDAIAAAEFQAMPGGGRGPMAGRRAERFAAMDADGDGTVTFEEFLTAGRNAYAAADADGDGTVTIWEFRMARRRI